MNNITEFINDMDQYFSDILINPIATEGKIEDVRSSIGVRAKGSSQKINNWYSNMLLNVNHFKNAQLDEQQNKDLTKVLNIAQPNTELNFKLFQKYYDLMKITGRLDERIDGKPFGLRSGPQIEGRMTTLKRELEKSISDLKSCMKAAKNSQEYKRLTKNDYENANLQNIPLSGIITDLKKSKQSAAYFQSNLDKFNEVLRKLKHVDETTERMCVFLNLVTSYYKFRIGILQIYFTRAKASLNGTLRNIVDKNESQFKTSSDKSLSKAKWLTKKMKPGHVKHLQDIYEQALKAPSYREYKPLYDELTNALGLNGKIIRKMKFDIKNGTISAYWVETNITKISLGGQKLYHGVPAGVQKLTEIKPAYCGKDGYLYPEPRIYWHMGVPLNRCSNKPDAQAGERSYTPREAFQEAWKDNELGGTAVYTHSMKSVPVKSVQLNRRDTINNKQIKLDFNNFTQK